jgi:pilus assembly protein FimV
MHRIIRNTPPSFAVKALTAVIAAITFTGVNAAGLGKLTVLSSLGQPLRAEIELNSVTKDEAGSLVARLASAQAFRQANVEFNPALASVRFSIEQRGQHQVIRITSSQSINEPYMGMLLELGSSRGRLLREYTFLLDPAELRHSRPASIAAPVAPDVVAAPIAAAELPSQAEQQVAEPGKKGKSARRGQKSSAESQPSDGKNGYRVKSGDTLGTIAQQHKPDEVSLEQMLVSLYRSNPDAFIGNNMNRLKSGRIMTIPDAAAAGSITGAEARSVIVAQSADFNQYRNKLAGMVAQAPAQQSDQSAQAVGGKITAKVEEQPTAASKSVDKLKLSKENAAAGDKAGGVVSTEDKLSKEKASADAHSRIKELEKNIKDLQGVIDLKSKDMSAQQKQADKVADASPVASAATVAGVAAPAVATAPPTPAAAVVKPTPRTAPPPPPEPGFFDDLLDNTTMLGAIGAAVLGFGVLLWSGVQRKKKAKEISDQYLVGSAEEAQNSLFGSPGGQSVNTNNSIFNSSFTPSASQLDTNEVDPVAEADVYIAYGRDAQAIEILKDALRAQPERNAVRIKLLEVYASQNDVLSFDAVASDLYALTKGEGEDWTYAAKLGASIDPKNPLYTDNALLEDIADKPASLHLLTNPVAELDPDSLMASTRLQTEYAPAAPQPERATEPKAVEPTAEQLVHPDMLLDIGLAEEKTEEMPLAAVRDAPAVEVKGEPQFLDSPNLPKEAAEADFALLDLPFEKVEVAAAPEQYPPLEASESTLAEFENMLDFYTKQEKPAVQKEAAAGGVEQTTAQPLEELAVQPAMKPLAAEAPSAKSSPAVVDFDMPPSEQALPEFNAQSSASASPSPAPIEFDFSNINLELGAASPELADYKPAASGEAAHDSNIEMATKMDLAAAYLEIGDKEGARELLEEVVKGGTAEQIVKAKETLTKLS